jgi:hypothetical protein
MKFYWNVPRSLKDSILDIGVGDRFAPEVATSDTEHDVGFRKHLEIIKKLNKGTTRGPFRKTNSFQNNSWLSPVSQQNTFLLWSIRPGSGVQPYHYSMQNGVFPGGWAAEATSYKAYL